MSDQSTTGLVLEISVVLSDDCCNIRQLSFDVMTPSGLETLAMGCVFNFVSVCVYISML